MKLPLGKSGRRKTSGSDSPLIESYPPSGPKLMLAMGWANGDNQRGSETCFSRAVFEDDWCRAASAECQVDVRRTDVVSCHANSEIENTITGNYERKNAKGRLFCGAETAAQPLKTGIRKSPKAQNG